jgi:hypothetical protein
MDKCIGNGYTPCYKDADYIRHTQFAGSHYLCEEHANEDENFLEDDSYQVWEKIS